jgi:hypothetical protein
MRSNKKQVVRANWQEGEEDEVSACRYVKYGMATDEKGELDGRHVKRMSLELMGRIK